MLRQQADTFRRIAVFLDMCAMLCAFFLAYYLRSKAGALTELNDYAWILLFALPVCFFLLSHFSLYESLRTHSYAAILAMILKSHAALVLVISSLVYLIDPHHFSRILLGSFIALSFFFIATLKILIKLGLAHMRRKGYNFRNVLVIGSGHSAESICSLIEEHDEWGLRIFVLQLDRVPSIDYGSKITVLDGTPDSVIEICKVHMIDEVLIFLPRNEHDLIDRLIEELQIIGVTTRVAIDYLSLPGLNKEAGLLFGEIPMLTYSHFSLNSDQLLAKRLLDILGSIVGLMLNLLMFPFIAAAIKLDSPGPVFFGQRRIGEHGRNFTCWKYRTMYLDAEAKKQELMAQNEMNGAMFKITSDPRITRVGRLLRRLSLDEFPQFWNVLTGDMSMVGTRPPTPDEVAVYENWQRKRISIRPGITGLWQISGRSTIRNFDDVVRLDIEYIESWSIWLDIRIILKTPLVIFNQQGAH